MLPGYDLIVQAISGLMSLTGDPDGDPYRAGISVFDVMAGLHAMIGVLAALHHRHDTGAGQHVEVNLLSSALSGMVNQSSAYVAGGVVPHPDGQQPPEPVPVRAVPVLGPRPDRHRRQQRPVPQALRGARRARARRRPAVRAQRGPHRQPGPAAPAARRAAADPHRPWSGSATSSRRASRAGRSTPSTPASRSPRTSVSSRWWPSVPDDDAVDPPPDPLLRQPGRLPAPTAVPRRARRGDPRLAGPDRSPLRR